MQIGFTVRLPVDAHSVPVIRALRREALEHLRIGRPIIDEITPALSEACANVVQHAGPLQDYEVRVDIDDECRISVVDDGAGFDPAVVEERSTGTLIDGARGLLPELVDTLNFQLDPGGRHRVAFTKKLRSKEPVAQA